ncbi:unnamed protein product [Fraxinus pennsylvanica]|uniref:Chaperone DnaJ C-terminal domain-containing protein n=1 Tax=Fraxinus pennsylvanica TaxID=56036 RepID=A0AAD1ZIG2_9LAMI|nr:unnamed protein product [Fraxinus pennsylvanica]
MTQETSNQNGDEQQKFSFTPEEFQRLMALANSIPSDSSTQNITTSPVVNHVSRSASAFKLSDRPHPKSYSSSYVQLLKPEGLEQIREMALRVEGINKIIRFGPTSLGPYRSKFNPLSSTAYPTQQYTPIQKHSTHEVVFYEDGEPIIDGEAGDLKFRIHTAPHDGFRREGNDLHTTVTITLVQALVGFEKTIKHLDDHLVDISLKGITKPKEVRKFKGEGMPLHFSNKKGDLYVKFEVLFPTSLTEDQKTKIKAILD